MLKTGHVPPFLQCVELGFIAAHGVTFRVMVSIGRVHLLKSNSNKICVQNVTQTVINEMVSCMFDQYILKILMIIPKYVRKNT